MATIGNWYSPVVDGDGADDRILCELCPRACKLKPDDRGFCFVRKNVDGKMVLDTYGKSTGFCIDPIEKKPLNHFLPGTPVLSFGTAGCNLGCKFCQNWDISKSREVARLSDNASPEAIAEAAKQSGCRSVAFTYNDPVIWAEYAIDTAAACHEQDIKTVAVTAGYITEQARGDFFGAMDAANIDLKAFTESFYFKLTGSHLQPVLDTIRYVCNETDCWVELTNLIIPDANDDSDETRRLADWLLEAVGPDVPVHFTAFHPDFRMTDRPRTSHETLVKAYDIARSAGLRYVYVGNVRDVSRQSTYCHQCGGVLIQRDWHQLGQYALNENQCQHCQAIIPGVFESRPGDWGQKRQRIKIASPSTQPISISTQPTPPTTQPLAVQQSPHQTLDLTNLSDEQKSSIHAAACQMVGASVLGTDQSLAAGTLGELSSQVINGVYVTLKRDETLRGCCGRQGAPMLLGESMMDSASRTTQDPRMAPIAPVELPFLNLSVSLLGPPRPIGVSGDARIDAVKIGQHGLRIQMGQNAGLLLPSVAVEQSWDARQFLDGVCRKAGLPAGAWRSDDANVMLFDGTYFGDAFKLSDESRSLCTDRVFVSDAEMQALHTWATNNLHALLTGATPFYYATGVSDSAALGLILKTTHEPSAKTQSWLQLSVRDGVPMQSMLFRMTQQAAQWVANSGLGADLANVRLSISALHQAVHHGFCKDADVRGVDQTHRAVIATDGKHWAVQFDKEKSAEQLLGQAMEMESFREQSAQLYSMVCQATDTSASVSLGPRGETEKTARPPAVASRFYPGDDGERDAQIDGFLAELPSAEKVQVSAAMVPHAGLRFSGKVATDVWRRIELPKRVLIIGPKHTPDGLDWAVAPHDRWQLSTNVSFTGAASVAAEIAESVPGMELDAAAHRSEHGIEVQLPILARLAPETEIIAIAMHGGTMERLTEAATALAGWLEKQEEPPLLVISSDMNHYADDTENRRRDRLALDAMKTGDAEKLLETCQNENISMCGQVPAALVMLTLKALGKRFNYNEIAYATSADAGADKARVVGYAGVLM